MDFEIDFIKELPHYKVEWQGLQKITPMRYKASNLTKGLARLIQIYLTEGFNVPDVNGELSEVKELYIFLNSITTRKQIVDTLELKPDGVKICCATRIRNTKILGENYEIESVNSPNKRINFFTRTCLPNVPQVVPAQPTKLQTWLNCSCALKVLSSPAQTSS